MNTRSVGTPNDIIAALRNLQTTNAVLAKVQEEAAAFSDPAPQLPNQAPTLAISRGIQANIQSQEAVSQIFSMTKGILSAAIAATADMAGSLTLLKTALEKRSAAPNNAPLNADAPLLYLRDQIRATIASATFQGVNILASAAPKGGVGVNVRFYDLAGEKEEGWNVIADAMGAATTPQDYAVLSRAIERFEARVAQTRANLGADSQSVALQEAFTQALSTPTLPAQDLTHEAATLLALQIKQQLEGQKIAIANKNPTVLKGLLR